VYQMVYSGNGRLLATAGLDRDAEPPRREIIVWNMETKQLVARFNPTPSRVAGFQGALAISQDGRWLAFDDFASGTGLIHLVDLRTKQIVRHLSGHAERITSLAFSADDRRLASADIAEQLKLWDLTTGKPLPVTLRGPRYSLAFSPDSQRLAAVDRQQVKLWDAITGHEIMTLRGQPPGSGDPGFNPCITWSKDGRLLAASNYDVTVTIWEGGEPVRE
jgi:WD40 repeat protein